MAVQNTSTTVDTEVSVAADLTNFMQDTRLSDGYRAFVKAAGPSHGLWILDKESVTAPDGVTVVLTMSGTGRWTLLSSGPPGPAGLGASWKFSGTMNGSAGAQILFAADVPNALATSTVGYPRPAPSGNGVLYVNATANGTTGNTILRVYINGVASALFVTFGGGVTGNQTSAAALPIVAGDRVDLRVDNAGAVGDVGQQFSFAASLEFTP